MNPPTDLPTDVRADIDDLVSFYGEEQTRRFVETTRSNLLDHIASSKDLMAQIHSHRSRLKSSESLRDKLHRQYSKAVEEGNQWNLHRANLLVEINDLVGLRLLHLHTRQFGTINAHLHKVFDEFRYEVVEGPWARTWDDEYRAFFADLDIKTVESKTLYTSVHYVVRTPARTAMTAEIQVRTLMEEVWGEVDHQINYPHESDHLPIREQIRALARSTSASTRLVDAIFRSNDYLQGEPS